MAFLASPRRGRMPSCRLPHRSRRRDADRLRSVRCHADMRGRLPPGPGAGAGVALQPGEAVLTLLAASQAATDRRWSRHDWFAWVVRSSTSEPGTIDFGPISIGKLDQEGQACAEARSL